MKTLIFWHWEYYLFDFRTLNREIKFLKPQNKFDVTSAKNLSDISNQTKNTKLGLTNITNAQEMDRALCFNALSVIVWLLQKHVSPFETSSLNIPSLDANTSFRIFFGLMDSSSSLRLKFKLCKFVTTSSGVSEIWNKKHWLFWIKLKSFLFFFCGFQIN